MCGSCDRLYSRLLATRFFVALLLCLCYDLFARLVILIAEYAWACGFLCFYVVFFLHFFEVAFDFVENYGKIMMILFERKFGL